MQKTWNRIKENAGAIAATCMVVGILAGFFQYSINSIHLRLNAQDKYINQRFDDLEKRMEQGFAHAKEVRQKDFAHLSQRFDDQDRRIEDLAGDVSELHRLTLNIGERVSRNENDIQQLQTAVPSP